MGYFSKTSAKFSLCVHFIRNKGNNQKNLRILFLKVECIYEKEIPVIFLKQKGVNFMMKKLNKFVRFDCQAFLAGKVIQNLNAKPWTDCETKEILGTVLEVVIVRDHTDYHLNSDEQQENNLYEKINVKVAKIDLQVPAGAGIEFVNPVGTIYGEFQNKLSIRCDDVRILQGSRE